jgi:hypothetical protein
MTELNKDDIQYVNSAGDGACLFNSVAQAVHLDESIKKYNNNPYTFKLSFKEIYTKSRELRLKSVEWIKDNLDLKVPPTDLTIKEDIQDSIDSGGLPDSVDTINKYLTYMKKKSSYGGQPEICALAHILNRNINVFKSSGNNYTTSGLGYTINEDDHDNDIYLFHNMNEVGSSGGHHYDLLYPNRRAQIISKVKYNKSKTISKSSNKSASSKSSSSKASSNKSASSKSSSSKASSNKSASSKSSSSKASSNKSSLPSNISSNNSSSKSSSSKASSNKSSLPSNISSNNSSIKSSSKSSNKSSLPSNISSNNSSIKSSNKSSSNKSSLPSNKSSSLPSNKSSSIPSNKSSSLPSNISSLPSNISSSNKSSSLPSNKSVSNKSSIKPSNKSSIKPSLKKSVSNKSVKTYKTCNRYRKKTPSPGCANVPGCKWVVKVGCLNDDKDLIQKELNKKSIKNPKYQDVKGNKCNTYKKNKQPRCNDQEGCKWNKKKGNKPGYCGTT